MANIGDAFDAFFLDCAARRLATSTQRTYRIVLDAFSAWCDARPLHAITRTDIRRFLVSLQDKGLSSHTQHKYARTIKTFFNFCVAEDLLSVSPFSGVRMPRVDQAVLKSFTANEIGRILEACRSERDRTIVLMLLDCGVRASELLDLTVGDVDMSTGSVTIQRGKGGRGRTVYIGVRVRTQLGRYLGGRTNGHVFLSAATGRRLTLYGIAQAMRRIEKRSGVDNVTCHAFRRTFALEFLRNGGNIYILAKLMGHSDIDVLRRYLAIAQDDLQAAHAQFGPGDRMNF